MKLTPELIDAYLKGSLAKPKAAQLKLWLKAHPKDAALVQRQQRLSLALSSSAPSLSPQDSRRLWIGIRARVLAEARPVVAASEPWYAFVFQRWTLPVGAGFALAALALFIFLPRSPAPTSIALPPPGGEGPASVQRAGRRGAPSAAPEAALSAAPRPQVPPESLAKSSLPPPGGGGPVAVQATGRGGSSEGPTEVEQALADSGVDGMIDAYLASQRQGGRERRIPALSQHSQGSSLVGLSRDSAMPSEAGAAGAIQGGPDNNGFWNWRPAALALNQRNWAQAQVELQAAQSQAPAPTERAFAASALSLLAAPGQPLQGQGEALPATGDLRVQAAGAWQLQVNKRLASFGQGVITRLPGFRSQGDSLELDLTFDRASFAPGTRFTRLSGGQAATVLDASGQAVSADEFGAPAGATYNVSAHQLQLR